MIYDKLLFLIFEIFFLKKKELLAFFNARSSLTIRLKVSIFLKFYLEKQPRFHDHFLQQQQLQKRNYLLQFLLKKIL